MSQKLYVGGLPYSTSQADLQNHFAQAGSVVSVQIITDKQTGKSRGFGFVEMETEEDGQRAIDMFNGQDFGGRTLTVNVARPMSEGGPRRDNGGHGGGRGHF